MPGLKERILHAHGGQRWSQATEVLASCSVGGIELLSRFQLNALRSVDVHLQLAQGRLSLGAYPQPGQIAVFTGAEVWIEDKQRRRLSQRALDPSRTVRPWPLWDQLDVLAFVGTWLWQALQSPFLLAAAEVECHELGAVMVGAERWQRLRVRFPPGLPVLAAEQLIYADATGLVRRVDYTPLHYGPWMRAAQCLDGHESFGGFIYPTRRVVYPCLVGGHLARLTPLSWLTLDDISVIRGQAA